jgi:hypothetical protein
VGDALRELTNCRQFLVLDEVLLELFALEGALDHLLGQGITLATAGLLLTIGVGVRHGGRSLLGKLGDELRLTRPQRPGWAGPMVMAPSGSPRQTSGAAR